MKDNAKSHAGKVLTTVIIIALLTLVGYVIYFARDYFLIGFLSIILSVFIRSISSALQNRFRMPSSISYTIGLFALILVMLTPFASISVPLISQIQKFVNNLPQFTEGMQELFTRLTESVPFLFARIDLDSILNDLGQNLQRIFSGSLSYIGVASGSVANFVIMIVLAAFIARNPMEYKEMVMRFVPKKDRSLFSETLKEIEDVLKHWIVGMLLDIIYVGLLTTIGYLIIGLDFFLVFGIAAGFLSLIPFFGPIIGALAPLSYALIESPQKAVGVLIVYAIVQFTESNFFIPYVMRKQVHLPPAVSILAVLIFAKMFGIMGIIIAVPMTASIVLLAEKMLNRQHSKSLDILRSVDPPFVAHTDGEDIDAKLASS
jgi:predicted PurR-regulated permease PerM